MRWRAPRRPDVDQPYYVCERTTVRFQEGSPLPPTVVNVVLVKIYENKKGKMKKEKRQPTVVSRLNR